MTWREISPESMNRLEGALLVDVRSPCEHACEHIPGSLNMPLLSDEERAEVGKIYKNQGEVAARRHALQFIAPKIPALVDEILAARRPGQSLVVHCWRGGLRSEAVASFLSVVGVDCWRLTGGYKAWRNALLRDFQDNKYAFQPLVLDGFTGAGKTDILRELQGRGCSVLDLEGLARHRGSVFGGLGLGAQPTQKNFDALLWSQLRSFGNKPVFMEAESRKIGRLSLPDCVYDRINSGRRVLVTGSLDARARRIVDDYGRAVAEGGATEAVTRLHSLKERLGARRVEEIESLAQTGDLIDAVKILLEEYYDPLYRRQIERGRPFELEVSGDDPAAAAEQLAAWAHK